MYSHLPVSWELYTLSFSQKVVCIGCACVQAGGCRISKAYRKDDIKHERGSERMGNTFKNADAVHRKRKGEILIDLPRVMVNWTGGPTWKRYMGVWV